ncbi:zinc finger protein 2 [Drosophila pseudoobscura]|uniref:Zinc finger protein 2 n=1 Tax=Drosophila pseudoobscura pseudoobscura TaxID=46245 RepID=A0A6I8UW87_DROPS|nr:zinc finger protein 2 [Drosophila pseudoobscura]
MSSSIERGDPSTDTTRHVDDNMPSQECVLHCNFCGNVYENEEAYNKDHHSGSCLSGIGRDEFQTSGTEETNLVEEEEIVEADVPLWDVIDDPQQVDAESERYFCFDCHIIYESHSSAENHVCPPEGAANVASQNASMPRQPTRRKVARATADGDYPKFNCKICNTVFNTQKSLKFHMRIHDEPKLKRIQDALPVGALQEYSGLDLFFCEICQREFDYGLKTIHQKMHTEAPSKFVCGTCNRQFKNSTNYRMHLKMHEKKQAEPSTSLSKKDPVDKSRPEFPCQYCGKVFYRPFEKVKHERVHTGEKPYACEACGKRFRVSYSLTLHLRSHTDIRPYVCIVCNKRFKLQSNYTHHLHIHDAERQFSCDMCSKSFRTSVQLNAHKNSHTKPFECEFCNRPFSTLYAVNNHMKTHKNDPASKSTLVIVSSEKKDTVKVLTSGKFRCSECGAEYSRIYALRQHLKSIHGMVEGAHAQKNDPPSIKESRVAEANDSEAAIRKAAAEADAAYRNAVVNDVDVSGSVPTYQEAVAFDVDNFDSEEIISDWLK